MATHSSVLARRIQGTGEPGGLPSMGSHRVGHDWSDLAAAEVSIQSMEFSRPEYRSGSAGDLPNPGIEPKSPALQADSLPSELPGKPPKEVHLIFKLILEKFPLILRLPAKSHKLWLWPWVSSHFRVSPGAASVSHKHFVFSFFFFSCSFFFLPLPLVLFLLTPITLKMVPSLRCLGLSFV